MYEKDFEYDDETLKDIVDYLIDKGYKIVKIFIKKKDKI